ncbi:cysteine dioxygenase family protein [Conexibacter stalactiti]|uniref:Cysteine dioxygenase family protein n=1 Tax=Conexibacter stalactiti TaxID=1940611 RepID=A0ABU4HTP8_9ACTN|nr:cysteine dioxygenase family protein [Conexibacter stalactiti]MDW5596559.1 cysteine dioxygenase family protein [Conexibacter stalactiti]MEC5037201.1 cysteine dioxygenase family protein [Conexibacter stalactiti]
MTQIDRPTGRDLTREELRTLAQQIAENPSLWSEHVAHDPSQRTYAELLRDDHVDVWLICWSEDHDTGFHDHDASCGAVAVIDGAVREERLVLGGEPARRVARAGESFDFGNADIHRVLHHGDVPAVTVHVYSPPLLRMGSYLVEDDGTLQRHSVSYEEELVPLEPAASV